MNSLQEILASAVIYENIEHKNDLPTFRVQRRSTLYNFAQIPCPMKRIAVIEVLRALASLSVALFHFGSQLHSAGARFVHDYGWLGVDVFFVISGFVVPLSLYGRQYSFRHFPSFMLRRLIRLEPAYLVSVGVVILLWHASSAASNFSGQAPNYSFSQIMFHLFYLVPLTRYQWLSPVYWSLAYEFVFYIIVGIFFGYAIKRNIAVTVSLAACPILLSFLLQGIVDVRIVEFLIGAILMRLVVHNRNESQALCWLATSVALVFFTGGLATGTVVTISVFAILFLRDMEFGPAFTLLGSISYSLYLIHVPVGGRVVNLAMRFGEGALYETITVVAALFASILAALVMHQLIEIPSIRASRRVRLGNQSI